MPLREVPRSSQKEAGAGYRLEGADERGRKEARSPSPRSARSWMPRSSGGRPRGCDGPVARWGPLRPDASKSGDPTQELIVSAFRVPTVAGGPILRRWMPGLSGGGRGIRGPWWGVAGHFLPVVVVDDGSTGEHAAQAEGRPGPRVPAADTDRRQRERPLAAPAFGTRWSRAGAHSSHARGRRNGQARPSETTRSSWAASKGSRPDSSSGAGVTSPRCRPWRRLSKHARRGWVFSASGRRPRPGTTSRAIDSSAPGS